MDANSSFDLPEPAFYFPMRSGKYDVAPGLMHLSAADFGNGDRDRLVFQIDREYPKFRTNEQLVRASADRYRHSGRADYAPEIAAAVTRLIVERLTTEHPKWFTREDDAYGAFSLACRLTGEILRFNSDAKLVSANGEDHSGYDDALGALCAQVPEDIAVVHRAPDGGDRIVALEISTPSHWSPEEKLGGSFDATHAPVPGMERSRAASSGLVNAMIHRPSTVRFTWGIEFSDRLNQHPAEAAEARVFATEQDIADAPLFLRVERQTLWGLPDVEAALFAIRVYIYDLAEVIRARPERRDAITAALRSMSPKSRLYKGLPPATFDAVIAWLGARAA